MTPDLFFTRLIDPGYEGAFAVFRLPDETNSYLSESERPLQSGYAGKEGFLFAPFNPTERPAVFIPGKPVKLSPEFLNPMRPLTCPAIPGEDVPDTLKADFVNSVNQFKKIQENRPELKKIVLSAVKSKAAAGFDPVKTFRDLSEAYPRSFILFFFSRVTGCWIGASPEPLIRKKGDRITLAAMAGTQPVQGLRAWNPKEVSEFDYVDRFITELIERHGLEDTKARKTETFRFGPVAHLFKNYICKVRPDFSLSGFVEDLHPTPAVCGTPRPQARELIGQLEKHRRGYYTGHFGLISDELTLLHVNLRSVKWNDEKLYFFAGAGIIRESDPEKEWEEIFQKMHSVEMVL